MNLIERKEKLAEMLIQAQQQATQWVQRAIYLQGQIDLVNELSITELQVKPSNNGEDNG